MRTHHFSSLLAEQMLKIVLSAAGVHALIRFSDYLSGPLTFMSDLLHFIRNNWVVMTLLLLLTITVLSLWPQESLPDVPGTDKTHHLLAYAALIFPVVLRKPGRWLGFGLFFIAYSGLIELTQPWVNRHGEWLDMAANTTGLICGAVIAALFHRWLKSKR